MLFDLDKARRYFSEDVRFAVEGGIDKDAAYKAVLNVLVMWKEDQRRTFQNLAAYEKMQSQRWRGYYQDQLKRACDSLLMNKENTDSFKQLFGKNPAIPEPISEKEVFWNFDIRGELPFDRIKKEYQDITGEGLNGNESVLKSIRNNMTSEYRRWAAQESRIIVAEYNRKLADCKRRAGI